MIKILNLYCGIGGNRKMWLAPDIEITAVEINPKIAKAYQYFFPMDKVIIADAHKYLLEHFKEFDFIWSSPPCPTHSKLRTSHPDNIVYPDMRLYQEILLLQQFFKGKWVVENVEPYYIPLIRPSAKIDRHIFWANFAITPIEIERPNIDVSRDNYKNLSIYKDFNLDSLDYLTEKRLLLRNAVHPRIGSHIINCAIKEKQEVLI